MPPHTRTTRIPNPTLDVILNTMSSLPINVSKMLSPTRTYDKSLPAYHKINVLLSTVTLATEQVRKQWMDNLDVGNREEVKYLYGVWLDAGGMVQVGLPAPYHDPVNRDILSRVSKALLPTLPHLDSVTILNNTTKLHGGNTTQSGPDLGDTGQSGEGDVHDTDEGEPEVPRERANEQDSALIGGDISVIMGDQTGMEGEENEEAMADFDYSEQMLDISIEPSNENTNLSSLAGSPPPRSDTNPPSPTRSISSPETPNIPTPTPTPPSRSARIKQCTRCVEKSLTCTFTGRSRVCDYCTHRKKKCTIILSPSKALRKELCRTNVCQAITLLEGLEEDKTRKLEALGEEVNGEAGVEVIHHLRAFLRLNGLLEQDGLLEEQESLLRFNGTTLEDCEEEWGAVKEEVKALLEEAIGS